jgi:hypothetical protein
MDWGHDRGYWERERADTAHWMPFSFFGGTFVLILAPFVLVFCAT